MSTLPPEVLPYIFRYLPQSNLLNVVQVSKFWKRLATPFLWCKPRFKLPNLLSYASFFKIYGQFIRDVEFDWNNRSTVEEVQLVIDTCGNIDSVKIRLSEDETQEIKMLCDHLSNRLECLSITNYGWIDRKLQWKLYLAMFGNLKRLELENMGDLDDITCEQIVTKSSLLEDLEFDNVGITDIGVRSIAQHLPRLRSLTLSGCDQITCTSLTAIADSCSLLENLYFGNTSVRDTNFTIAGQRFQHLRSLNLINCYSITDNFFIAIVGSGSCPFLEDLCLKNTNITDTGIRLILQHLQRLSSLTFILCDKITDESLIAIAGSCRLLTSFSAHRMNITDIGLSAIASAPCRKTITCLHLKECDRITDTGVRQIVTQLDNLRHLNISCCSLLTEGLFREPSWKCAGLVELDISHLDVRLSALSSILNLKSLKSLHFNGIKGDVSECVHPLIIQPPKPMNGPRRYLRNVGVL
jgi:hypothetical protein